jgi:hypothetical protein
MTCINSLKKLKLNKNLDDQKERIVAFLKKTNKVQVSVFSKNNKTIANFPFSFGLVMLLFAPSLIGICAGLAYIFKCNIELEKE